MKWRWALAGGSSLRGSIASVAAMIAATSLLAGCETVTPEHVPLSGSDHAGLSSTELVLPVQQSEIYIDVPPSHVSTYTGGGLLPALIDAGIDNVRASNAARDVTPLRNAVVDFDFDSTLQGQLSHALGAADGVHVDEARVIKDASDQSLDAVVTASKSGDVLIAATNYHLANDGGSLWIEVHAALYKSGPAASGGHASQAANALYRNTFWYAANLPSPTPDRAANLAQWSANHGERLRTELSRGCDRIAQMLVADLQTSVGTIGAAQVAGGNLERKVDGTEVFRAN